MIIINLDKFKEVNETKVHAEEQRCLEGVIGRLELKHLILTEKLSLSGSTINRIFDLKRLEGMVR